MEENEWIYVNQKLYGIDKNIKSNLSGVEKLTKPIKPNLKSICKEFIGFNLSSLKKEFKKLNMPDGYFINEIYFNYFNEFIFNVGGLEVIGTDNFVKNYGSYMKYNNLLDYWACIDIFNYIKNKSKNELEKYLNWINKCHYYQYFIQNHEKYIEYKIKYKEYTEKNKKINKLSRAKNSDWAKPGTLVQLYYEKTNSYFSFILGSLGNLTDLKLAFPKYKYSDIVVIRTKLIIDEKDIQGDLLFS